MSKKAIIQFSSLIPFSDKDLGRDYSVKRVGLFADLLDTVDQRECRLAESTARLAMTNIIMSLPGLAEAHRIAKTFARETTDISTADENELESDAVYFVRRALASAGIDGYAELDVINDALLEAEKVGRDLEFCGHFRKMIRQHQFRRSKEKRKTGNFAGHGDLDYQLAKGWSSEGLWLLKIDDLAQCLFGNDGRTWSARTVRDAIKRLKLHRATGANAPLKLENRSAWKMWNKPQMTDPL
jgi:hypothetical protein